MDRPAEPPRKTPVAAPRPAGQTPREAKLAEALRANLRRRKAAGPAGTGDGQS